MYHQFQDKEITIFRYIYFILIRLGIYLCNIINKITLIKLVCVNKNTLIALMIFVLVSDDCPISCDIQLLINVRVRRLHFKVH